MLSVDGVVLAQPLYVANYPVNGANHNLLIVATEHDSVYAFDADSGAVLWHSLLGPSQSSTDVGCTGHRSRVWHFQHAGDRPFGRNDLRCVQYRIGVESADHVLGALDLGSGTTKIALVHIMRRRRRATERTSP